MAARTQPVKPDPGADDAEDGLVDKIREVVGETIGALFDSGKADVEDGAEKRVAEPASSGRRLTLTDIEEASARAMRKALDELHGKSKEPPDAGGDGSSAPPSPAPPETTPATPSTWREKLWG